MIHAVGPVWHGGSSGEARLLAGCYRRAGIELANDRKLTSIAFPAISTGIYGYPKREAATIAVDTVRTSLADAATITRVIFCSSTRRPPRSTARSWLNHQLARRLAHDLGLLGGDADGFRQFKTTVVEPERRHEMNGHVGLEHGLVAAPDR